MTPISLRNVENRYLEAIEQSKKLPPPDVRPHLPYPMQDQLSSCKALEPIFQEISRPKLPLPESTKRAFIYDLLELQCDAEKTIDQLTKTQADDLKEAIKRHETTSIELLKKQQELSDAKKTASYWEAYRQISSTLTTALTFFAAATLSPAGAVTARWTYALLASGSSALFNQGMTLSGGWEKISSLFTTNKATQEQIAFYLEKSLTIGSSLLSFASLWKFGSTLQANLPEFWTKILGSDPDASRVANLVTKLVDVTSVFLGIKSGADTARNYEMEKEVKLSENASMLYQSHSQEVAKSVRESSENQKQLNEACSDAVQSTIASYRIAAQSA